MSDDFIPHLRSKFVSDIAVADVGVDLLPLWITKSETAVQHSGKVERVRDYAEGQRLRSGPNPARGGPDPSSADVYRFFILTAARVGEVLAASWSEIDWDNRTWINPSTHHKTWQAYTIPLSDHAIEILEIVE